MIKRPSRSLVYDISNLLFRVAAVQKRTNPFAKDAKPEDLVGLCMHISLQSIHKWYYKFKPDFVVFAFEGKNNWRKKHTAQTKARLQYKANRVYDPEMKHYYELLDSFKETISLNTSVCCLSVDNMEADDMIGGYCQLYAADDHEIIIISGDKDFTQLLKLPKVKLVNPDNGKPRNLPGDKDYESDIDYWIFLKCIRGDMGDYVPSAFPRVRETRIRKAYQDSYERVNLMNEVWSEKYPEQQPDGTIVEKEIFHRVGDLFDQNVILLDLWKQPEPERSEMLSTVGKQVVELNKYSHFQFLRFLEKFQLNKVRDEASKFMDLFAHNQRFISGEKLSSSKPPLQKPEPATAKSSSLLEF